MTGSYGLDSFVLEEGAVAGSCKQGNETSGSTNDGGISWIVQLLAPEEFSGAS